MLARVTAATPWGIDALPVQVEVDSQSGLPQMHIVGLPDTAVRESRERVRAAIKNCGFELPPRAVVVNLAPADLRKEGNHLDLAIALGLLVAHGHLPQEALSDRLFSGELGLDGTIRPIRGGLAIAALSARAEHREVVLPAASAGEAAALRSVPVIPVAHLSETVEHLLGRTVLAPRSGDRGTASALEDGLDLSDVRGQETAKRALEIAAAGGHNLLFIGPPGAGKTMLAKRLPGLLPPLTLAEAIEVTKVQSLAAAEPPNGLIRRRPFRSPHPGTSTAGMVGGGSQPQPGEVSLAHNGVLFLDELPQFRRDTLEALRHPLEDARVTVVRARARLTFPARFVLMAAMNPCPCGHLGDPRQECGCPQLRVESYRGRISGPLLDRIDLHVEVPALALEELRGAAGESSAVVVGRVDAARQIQLERLGRDNPAPVNAALTATQVRAECRLEPAAAVLLDKAFERLGLSARAMDRILKVARTIADLAGSDELAPEHVAEAIQYRSLDRRLVG